MSIVSGPTPPDTNYAPMFLGVTGVFTLLSIGLCGARIWTRIRPEGKLRIDDYLVLVGTVSVSIWHIQVLLTLTDSLDFVYIQLFSLGRRFDTWLGPPLGICCERGLGTRLQVEFCATGFMDPRHSLGTAVNCVVPSAT